VGLIRVACYEFLEEKTDLERTVMCDGQDLTLQIFCGNYSLS